MRRYAQSDHVVRLAHLETSLDQMDETIQGLLWRIDTNVRILRTLAKHTDLKPVDGTIQDLLWRVGESARGFRSLAMSNRSAC